MPSTQIALLRGINVGRAKRVAMPDLRALLEGLGFQNVRTLLNSGNVVFGVPGRAKKHLAPTIEAAIEKELGVSTRVMVISDAELETIIAENPLLDVAKDPSRLLVGVLSSASDRTRLKPLLERKWGAESLAVGPRVAYMWCPKGIIDSELGKAVSKALGDSVTSRNWATILKLQALAKGSA